MSFVSSFRASGRLCLKRATRKSRNKEVKTRLRNWGTAMSRLGWYAAMICLLVASAGGCAICSSEHDCNYGMYGGTWERHHPSEGRVGSAFEPAGSPVIPTAAHAEPLEAPEKPQPSNSATPEETSAEDMELPAPTEPSTIEPNPGTSSLRRSSRPRNWTRQQDYLP
jgi:hypothetical protein